ncbi:hypothetical protein MLD38_008998 [Melastoma candidum]|uniref:Uncharacterized protein n=1 Tax=Melastoma candidum TaxID=119954 RepID=A0ACB9S4N9_9MYRT|nr:hypothetical protein MLD38_008998 [Melastoma candidum]
MNNDRVSSQCHRQKKESVRDTLARTLFSYLRRAVFGYSDKAVESEILRDWGLSTLAAKDFLTQTRDGKKR